MAIRGDVERKKVGTEAERQLRERERTDGTPKPDVEIAKAKEDFSPKPRTARTRAPKGATGFEAPRPGAAKVRLTPEGGSADAAALADARWGPDYVRQRRADYAVVNADLPKERGPWRDLLARGNQADEKGVAALLRKHPELARRMGAEVSLYAWHVGPILQALPDAPGLRRELLHTLVETDGIDQEELVKLRNELPPEMRMDLLQGASPLVQGRLEAAGFAIPGEPPAGLERAAKAFDIVHQDGKGLTLEQRQRLEDRLVRSDAAFELAPSWRAGLEAVRTFSDPELQGLHLREDDRYDVLRLVESALANKHEYRTAFPEVRASIDQVGFDRFKQLFDDLAFFAPSSNRPCGKLYLVGFDFEKAIARLGFVKAGELASLIKEDQAVSAVRFIAAHGGSADALIDAAERTDASSLRTLLHTPAQIELASDVEPPASVKPALGTEVPTAQALIQLARKWPSQQNDRYGPLMAAAVERLTADFQQGKVTSFRGALDAMSQAQRGIAGELNLNKLSHEDDAWGTWRKPTDQDRYSFVNGPGAQELADAWSQGAATKVNGASGIPLTTFAKLKAANVWLHTRPEDFDRIFAHVEPVFTQALKEKDPGRLVALVAQLHWWGAHMMPFHRGGAGAVDAITKALLLNAGIKTGQWRVDRSPDIWAFAMPLSEYVAAYPSFFQ